MSAVLTSTQRVQNVRQSVTEVNNIQIQWKKKKKEKKMTLKPNIWWTTAHLPSGAWGTWPTFVDVPVEVPRRLCVHVQNLYEFGGRQ